jgi:hypothetical protein
MVRPSTDSQLLKLCFVQIAGVAIAFHADHIERFVEEAEEDSPADVDLPELLRLTGAGDVTARRRALVVTEHRSIDVAVGSRLSLHTLLRSRIRPLPRLLEGLTARTGLIGVFEQAGGLAFLLDLARVPRRRRQSESRHPSVPHGDLMP